LVVRFFVWNEVLKNKLLLLMLGFKDWDWGAWNYVTFNRRWYVVTPINKSFINHSTLCWSLFLYLQPLNRSTTFLLLLNQGWHIDILDLVNWNLVTWDHLGFGWIRQGSFVHYYVRLSVFWLVILCLCSWTICLTLSFCDFYLLTINIRSRLPFLDLLTP
jgi:hypothetical protein